MSNQNYTQGEMDEAICQARYDLLIYINSSYRSMGCCSCMWLDTGDIFIPKSDWKELLKEYGVSVPCGEEV